MKIAILSCFYPFRGGIAQFNASLLGELGREHTARAFNFTLQYPSFLFPGKTQYAGPDDGALKVESTAVLSTVNPLSWIRTARAIRQWGADLLILRYWMPFFAPSLGYVARHCGKACKAIAIVDNAIPHERRFFDVPLTKWFLRSLSGAVTMSEEVASQAKKLRPTLPCTTLPHPLYSHFGEKMPKAEAMEALGIQAGTGKECRCLLFFGLIREYKGLDILIRAFGSLDSSYCLIIAGECYGDFSPYASLIESSPARERIHLFNRFIPDGEVRLFFSAADAVVLPYRSATQSGVGAVACSFEVPLVVTDTGALRRTIGESGIGIVVDRADEESVCDGVRRLFDTPGLAEGCRKKMRAEKERLSWRGFCNELIRFCEEI